MPPYAYGKLEYFFWTTVPPLIKVLYGVVGAITAVSLATGEVPSFENLDLLDATEYAVTLSGFLVGLFAYSVLARAITQDRVS